VVHRQADTVFRFLDLADGALPFWRCVAVMNDYARAAVWVAFLGAAAYAAPRLLHLWQQQRLLDFMHKPKDEAGTFDFDKAFVELEGDDGGYV